uniref:Uncharacterized protein n=1 Tax=viral metagenome TaxID=1070528 RepID=A0A6C0HFX3_9ZZZZ
MSSLLKYTKQTPMNGGYYVALAPLTSSYTLTGTEVAPAFSTLTSSIMGLATSPPSGSILRDEGKTLRSANRVFRKVQLLLSTGSVVTGGTDGVVGLSTGTSPWATFYVELPGPGTLATSAIARLG